MRILVTGGAGFIGSHVVDALLGCGHEVEVLDDLSTGRRENLPEGVPLHELDIRSGAAAQLVAGGTFGALVHHAAQMDVRKSVADPAFDADVNITGFLNLLEACRHSDLRKVVLASTGGAIYGEPRQVPQAESHVLQPVSPYGLSKLAAEKYLVWYGAQYGIQYAALRYGNVYGPRQNPHGEAGVVAIFLERMLRGEPPVINGDGRQTRDYVYVGDVAAANVAALDHKGSSLVCNVGTGHETDVLGVFRSLRAALGVDVPEVFGPAREGEQRRSVLDPAKAARLLGWSPKTDIGEGLRLTAAWFAAREH